MDSKKRITAMLLTTVMLVSFIPSTAMAAKAHWKTKGTKTYYILSTGKKAKGWKKISKKWYYFNSKGVMQTGLKTIKNKYYYFNSKGAMKKGWVTIKNKLHYFSKKDGHGLKSGWKTIGSNTYYFSSKGVAATGFKTIKGNVYYFNSKGAMKTGWLEKDGNNYYLDKNGIMATGFRMINVGRVYKLFYFDKSGVMLTGKQVIDGIEYDLGDDGELREVPEDDAWQDDKAEEVLSIINKQRKERAIDNGNPYWVPLKKHNGLTKTAKSLCEDLNMDDDLSFKISGNASAKDIAKKLSYLKTYCCIKYKYVGVGLAIYYKNDTTYVVCKYNEGPKGEGISLVEETTIEPN